MWDTPKALTPAQQRGEQETKDTVLQKLEILISSKTAMVEIIPVSSAQLLAKDHISPCGYHLQKTLTSKQ